MEDEKRQPKTAKITESSVETTEVTTSSVATDEATPSKSKPKKPVPKDEVEEDDFWSQVSETREIVLRDEAVETEEPTPVVKRKPSARWSPVEFEVEDDVKVTEKVVKRPVSPDVAEEITVETVETVTKTERRERPNPRLPDVEDAELEEPVQKRPTVTPATEKNQPKQSAPGEKPTRPESVEAMAEEVTHKTPKTGAVSEEVVEITETTTETTTEPSKKPVKKKILPAEPEETDFWSQVSETTTEVVEVEVEEEVEEAPVARRKPSSRWSPVEFDVETGEEEKPKTVAEKVTQKRPVSPQSEVEEEVTAETVETLTKTEQRERPRPVSPVIGEETVEESVGKPKPFKAAPKAEPKTSDVTEEVVETTTKRTEATKKSVETKVVPVEADDADFWSQVSELEEIALHEETREISEEKPEPAKRKPSAQRWSPVEFEQEEEKEREEQSVEKKIVKRVVKRPASPEQFDFSETSDMRTSKEIGKI